MDRCTQGARLLSYSDNYLIDTDHGVILDVETTRSIRKAEVGSTKTMLNRVKQRFDLHPERVIADTADGTGPRLGWLVERKIAPHIPVVDKSGRTDGTWSRADFEWDPENDRYVCPEGQDLKQFRRNYSDPTRGPTDIGTARYRALKEVCQACPSKPQHPDGEGRSASIRPTSLRLQRPLFQQNRRFPDFGCTCERSLASTRERTLTIMHRPEDRIRVGPLSRTPRPDAAFDRTPLWSSAQGGGYALPPPQDDHGVAP